MNLWYYFKAVFHFLSKYWWVFVSLLLGIVIALFFVFRKQKKPKHNSVLDGVSKKIEKQEINAKIELAKVKADTDKKVKQLEKIKKISDTRNRVDALAEFLTGEFSD